MPKPQDRPVCESCGRSLSRALELVSAKEWEREQDQRVASTDRYVCYSPLCGRYGRIVGIPPDRGE